MSPDMTIACLYFFPIVKLCAHWASALDQMNAASRKAASVQIIQEYYGNRATPAVFATGLGY